MIIVRVARVLWRLIRAHPFAPWRSALLRWRLATFGVTDAQGRLLYAEEITARRMLTFLFTRWREVAAFLVWAAKLDLPPKQIGKGIGDLGAESP